MAMTGIYPPIDREYPEAMSTFAHPIADPTTGKLPRFRRWIPLSLKMFVAMLGILGVIAGYCGMQIYRQHAAIQEIERLGGQVSSLPTGPNWLRGMLFVQRQRLFHDVIGVRLNDTPADDATLARLACLTKVQELSLVNTQVTD